MKRIIISTLLLGTLTACSSSAEKTPVIDKAQQISNYTTVSRTASNPEDPVHGKEVGFWYGALSGVDGTNANGVAYLRLYADGATVLTVNLNILPAPEGEEYTVAISDPAEGKEIDAGELRSIVGDARHSLTFEAKEDYSAMKTLTVFLGKNRVAEGVVKEPSKPAR